MVAINFTMFEDKVASRTKTQTVRKTTTVKPGSALQLYTGMRKKGARKLVEEDPICKTVSRVIVYTDRVALRSRFLTPEEADEFAQADGFSSMKEMRAWFLKTYNKPTFLGWCIEWYWPNDQTTA